MDNLDNQIKWIKNQDVLSGSKTCKITPYHINYKNTILDPSYTCAYSSETGLPLKETFLTRGITRQTNRFPFPAEIEKNVKIDREIESAIYVSFLNNHFGHLLTESIGNCWHAFNPPKEILKISNSNKPTLIINNIVGSPEENLLEQLKEKYDVIYGQQMQGRTLVKNLHTSFPTLILGYGISDEHNQEVNKFIKRIIGEDTMDDLCNKCGKDLIYISRQNIDPTLRRVIDEDSLVKHLSKAGWKIIHPQELSIIDQVSTYSDAKVIAGNIGSALHLLMSFGNYSVSMRSKLILALTEEEIPKTCPLQFKNQGVECEYLKCLKKINEKNTINPTLTDVEFIIDPFIISEFIHNRAINFL